MAYLTLPLVYQNVIFEQHSYILKWFVFLFLIFLSCYYVFVKWGDFKESIFWTVFVFRWWFLLLSIAYLFASPFTLLLMSPEYGFNSFYGIHITIYNISLFLLFTLLLIDFFRYGFVAMLKFAGVDIGDSNTNELVNALENRKFFIKISKRGKK